MIALKNFIDALKWFLPNQEKPKDEICINGMLDLYEINSL